MLLVLKYGKAYQRNRIKRLLRENYRNIAESLKKGYNIVFLVKKNTDVRNIDFHSINEDMFNIFNKAKLIDTGIKWKKYL